MSEQFTVRKSAPFRYDVVGSFLRPERLKAARVSFEAGKLSQAELTAVEDECIQELVEKELEVGLKSVTDGEFRRSYWHLDFMWGFDGIEHNIMEHGYFFQGEETRKDSARVVGKVKFSKHAFLDHFKFLQEVVKDRALVRLTIPAPAQFYAELVRGDNEVSLDNHYESKQALCKDLVQAYRDFIAALYKLGCRNLQLDDCTWGMLCDKAFWDNMAGAGYDLQALQSLYLNLNNQVIEDWPEDLVINTHICRGNYHSTWATSGGYQPVANTLFGHEKVNGFYLEFDDDRSGGFEPLDEVEDGKLVVLGLVTSKQAKLEDKQQIKKRIKEASRYVSLDCLCLSPQCGFASTEEGNILTEEEQWAKLRLIKEVAEEVWA